LRRKEIYLYFWGGFYLAASLAFEHFFLRGLDEPFYCQYFFTENFLTDIIESKRTFTQLTIKGIQFAAI
jgi:hypothetical protein